MSAETPNNTPAQAAETALITMREFFETTPPGVTVRITDLKKFSGSHALFNTPNIFLHCESEICSGVRTFSPLNIIPYQDGTIKNDYIIYTCQNCKKRVKTFSVKLNTHNGGSSAFKYGEHPAFGPPTPPRALKLIGTDRQLFFKGRRCELQGLGVGAFTYYRRVLEDQRNRIFDEIIRVLEKIDANNPVITDIKAAKEESQFTKSIEAIKHALPSSLLINGENPLRMLYSALSDGVHNGTDEECLEYATAVRTLLFEFSERLDQALRDDAELASAVSVLTKKMQR